MNYDKRITFGILIGGLVTFSVAHMVVIVLYILLQLKKKYLLIFIILAALGLKEMSNMDEFHFLFKRFEISDNGGFQGDNRSQQVSNYFNITNSDLILFGNYECYKRPNKECNDHGDISSSPVTPIYRGGVLIFVMQVLTHLVLISIVFRNKRLLFPMFTLTFMLLQRPYFTLISYQIMIYLLVFLSIKVSYPRMSNLKLIIKDSHAR